jgi:hypothetical protein
LNRGPILFLFAFYSSSKNTGLSVDPDGHQLRHGTETAQTEEMKGHHPRIEPYRRAQIKRECLGFEPHRKRYSSPGSENCHRDLEPCLHSETRHRAQYQQGDVGAGENHTNVRRREIDRQASRESDRHSYPPNLWESRKEHY